jgi:hypothetical protein
MKQEVRHEATVINFKFPWVSKGTILFSTKEKFMKKIGVNKSALRHTAKSNYSHFDGTWDELTQIVEENFDKHYPGIKTGSIIVPVPPDKFFSVIRKVDEKSKFIITPKSSSISVKILGDEIQADYAEIVLHSRETLGADASDEFCEWEIVTIRAADQKPPPFPLALAVEAQTDGTMFTVEQYMESILYWSTHATIVKNP